jgi:hypothetical protein
MDGEGTLTAAAALSVKDWRPWSDIMKSDDCGGEVKKEMGEVKKEMCEDWENL